MSKHKAQNDPESPPFFKKWRGWYGLLLITLALLISLFYLLSIAYQ